MKLGIRGHLVEVAASVKELVSQRMWFALGRYQEQIEEVMVRLSDENGPKGGRDKVCRVVVSIASRRLFVSEVAPDLPAAISRAAERIGRAVSRELERIRVFRQQEKAASARQRPRRFMREEQP
ncbi:MAG: HPF/RaiA family ribosome-associated protein [Acidimicrobiia bacterium]|nr:HPF/RaiA family ribosome-associated protein [Acidimicrobiia bacterium]